MIKIRDLLNENKNIDFLTSILANSMQHYEDVGEFVRHLRKQLKMDPKVLKKIYEHYWKLSPSLRTKIGFDWQEWLKDYIK